LRYSTYRDLENRVRKAESGYDLSAPTYLFNKINIMVIIIIVALNIRWSGKGVE